MKYLVTGGAGFIGSHIVEGLVARGDQVRVLDNLETGKLANLAAVKSKIEFIQGDIRDPATCRKSCQGVDYVFHEAALGSVPRSIEDPVLSNDVNVSGTLNVLVAAREAGVKRLVFASSSSVYGDTRVLPKVETMPPCCLSPYALNKYAAETYVALFYSLYGLETVSLRYFNVFGPRQDPDSQYAAVIPKFVTAIAQGKRPVIYGDGNQARDFTFVSDVVQANLLALTAPKQACGKAYNIARHDKTTINDLFGAIAAFIAEKRGIPPPKADYQPARAGDIRESLADIGSAKAMLGYDPRVDLKAGLQKTIDFFLND